MLAVGLRVWLIEVSLITQVTRGGGMPPSIVTAADDLVVTPEASKAVSDKSSDKLPAVFVGLDKAEALAYIRQSAL